MDPYLNNFGPRLRRLIEQRGTIEQAYAALGISRATLFNWFKRDRLPPGEAMIAKLRQYLGPDADEILDPRPISSSVMLAEDEAPYGTPEMLRQDIERHHRQLLAQAGNDVARLGWILIQQQSHLRAPAEWSTAPTTETKKKPLVVKAPAHQQNPIQPGRRSDEGRISA